MGPKAQPRRVPTGITTIPQGKQSENFWCEKYAKKIIAIGTSATKGCEKILKVKSMEINVIAIPASADNNAARGVTRRTLSATKAQMISMTPFRKQATSPTFHAQTGSLVS